MTVTAKKPAPIKRVVLSRIPKADDLEVHVSKATLNGVVVIDVRDYVPSLKKYGRGTTLPASAETLKALTDAVWEVKHA